LKFVRLALLIWLTCLHCYAIADNIDDVMSDIDRGSCEEAEKKTKRLFSQPVKNTLLGIIAQNCSKNRVSAIYFFTSAAMSGDPLAIEKLRLLGIQPPAGGWNQKIIGGTSDLDIPLPPPHQLPPPVPSTRPTYNAPTTCFPMNQGIGLPPMILCQ